MKRKYQTIFFGNRSYQEKKEEYGSVDDYFHDHFQSADIAFISSHLIVADIERMIINGKRLFYNLNGIFWSNSIENNQVANAQISSLDWNERFVIANPTSEDDWIIQRQLDQIANNITSLIINRAVIS